MRVGRDVIQERRIRHLERTVRFLEGQLADLERIEARIAELEWQKACDFFDQQRAVDEAEEAEASALVRDDCLRHSREEIDRTDWSKGAELRIEREEAAKEKEFASRCQRLDEHGMGVREFIEEQDKPSAS